MSRISDDQLRPPAEPIEQLFTRRKALQRELARVEAADPVDPRQLRHLRRRLDEATVRIVAANLGLVRSYTSRFTNLASGPDREEFEAAGLVGLMRAVDTYDPSSGSFGQWAFKPIQREVLRAVRDVDHPNLTFGDFEKRPAILRAFRQLCGVDGRRVPSDAEVAGLAGVSVSQVGRVLAPPCLQSLSLAHPSGESVADRVASDEPRVDARVVSLLTMRALEGVGRRVLDRREVYVIVRRFGLSDAPAERLAEIGAALGLTGESVRQIEARALAKLRHPLVLRKLAAHAA
jgi:RNA polymerase sigma factor (sigma-70 family)